MSEGQQIKDVQTIMNIPSEGSERGALVKVEGKKNPGGRPKGTKISLPPIANFLKILKKAGVTEKSLAETLANLVVATKETVDREGNVHSQPDNGIRLKAVELLLKYYLPPERDVQNHLHVHGKKLDELLGK